MIKIINAEDPGHSEELKGTNLEGKVIEIPPALDEKSMQFGDEVLLEIEGFNVILSAVNRRWDVHGLITVMLEIIWIKHKTEDKMWINPNYSKE